MKILLEKDGSFEQRVNFIDSNDVFVGYDLTQDCCEDADWFLSFTEDNEPKDNDMNNNHVVNYNFDTNYFEEVQPKEPEEGYACCLDNGNMVRFRLIAEGTPDIFLHLYNIHNGYYSHGFIAKVKGLDWKEGYV
jgi:hypothetical protein